VVSSAELPKAGSAMFKKPRHRVLSEAVAYSRCYGARSSVVRVVRAERDPRYARTRSQSSEYALR